MEAHDDVNDIHCMSASTCVTETERQTGSETDRQRQRRKGK